MKNKWLNVVLLLTNRVYQKKQQIVGRSGLGAVYNIFVLIVLEIILGVISLPLYVTLRSGKVVAFFQEKGAYSKVAFDYNLRRVLTLTGVGILVVIWLLKLALIVATPSVYGPLNLFQVENLSPADILSKELVATETGIQTARVVPNIAIPKLEKINKVRGGDYEFLGTGQPNSTIVLFLSGEQTTVYTADIDKNGEWSVYHSKQNFKLNDGNHSVLIFTYNKNLGTRSASAQEQFFKVKTTWLDNFVQNIDIMANWSVVIIILLGVLLTFLTI